MGTYNVHAGHCPYNNGSYGAVGVLNESIENRKVKNRVIIALRSAGNTVYDCTDDTNCGVNQNLGNIVDKCNAHDVNLDVSVHLNSGRNEYGGDGSTGGVEVWCYDNGTAEVAASICAEVSKQLGVRNRGVKYSKDLYVLRNTKNAALLVECCFVDDKDDADRWNADKCGDAIASGILNRSVSGASNSAPSASTSGTFRVKVEVEDLNIRKGPGTNYGVVKTCPVGVYTIVQTASGQGATLWGKLKSGDSWWVSLDYAKRV